jgi:hypothetical protein
MFEKKEIRKRKTNKLESEHNTKQILCLDTYILILVLIYKKEKLLH